MGNSQRKTAVASVAIQAAARGHLARCCYAQQRAGAHRLQRFARGVLERTRFLRERRLRQAAIAAAARRKIEDAAATQIQRTCGRGPGTRAALAHAAACQRSAVRVQRHWRGGLVRMREKRRQKATVGDLRALLAGLVTHRCASRIQVTWRGYVTRRDFLNTQGGWAYRVRKLHERRDRGARTLQRGLVRLYRELLLRRGQRAFAVARRIQAIFRGHRQRGRFKHVKKGVAPPVLLPSFAIATI